MEPYGQGRGAARVGDVNSPLRLKEDLILPVNLVYQAV